MHTLIIHLSSEHSVIEFKENDNKSMYTTTSARQRGKKKKRVEEANTLFYKELLSLILFGFERHALLPFLLTYSCSCVIAF